MAPFQLAKTVTFEPSASAAINGEPIGRPTHGIRYERYESSDPGNVASNSTVASDAYSVNHGDAPQPTNQLPFGSSWKLPSLVAVS